jgi:hypothetical protein
MSTVNRYSPDRPHPWRWLRFRCGDCRSGDVLVRAGAPIDLQDGPLPLWRREDLLDVIAEAIHTHFAYIGGDAVPISRDRARAVGETVMRRLIAAGLTM